VKQSGWRERLLESTRGRILEQLRTEDQTVNDLAAKLRLTDNAIRAHLLSLERDGLVRRSGTQAGFRKPHAVYGLTAEAEQLFPKAYGQLLHLVLENFERKLTPRKLRTSMREIGKKVAKEHLPEMKGKSRDQRIKAALRILKELGGVAVFDETGGKDFIRGRGCPLAEVTAGHREACLIAESLLSQIIGVPVKQHCNHNGSPSCRFQVS
jgi:predicted ArsR family transcriptional regulator